MSIYSSGEMDVILLFSSLGSDYKLELRRINMHTREKQKVVLVVILVKSSLNLILLGVYASKQQEEAEGEQDKRLKRIFP